MQIKQERFLDLMGSANTRFIIPVFQRVYSWDTRQCEELWEDVTRFLPVISLTIATCAA